MKSNPLFFDSTKFRGDTVIVDIELNGTDIGFKESLYVRVQRADGGAFVQMQPKGLKKWTAQARMEYQQKVELEFIVKEGENLVEVSDLRKITASYVIQQIWKRSPSVERFQEEALVNAPALVEQPSGALIPIAEYNRRLPMIVEVKKSPFENENFNPDLKIDDLV